MQEAERQYERCSQQPGYPNLYLKAWRLLIDRLKEEDGKFTFLQAFVNLWRQSNQAWDDLLLQSFFFMMTPHEAEEHLRLTALTRNEKPYLFRLSASVPGLVILSYMGPIKNTIHHRRLTDPALVRKLRAENEFYKTLAGGEREGLCDSATMKEMMRQIDADANLERLDKIGKLEFQHAFALIKSLYFHDTDVICLFPETTSYFESDRTDAINHCFHCHSSRVMYKESVNNARYCSASCYELDYNKCY